MGPGSLLRPAVSFLLERGKAKQHKAGGPADRWVSGPLAPALTPRPVLPSRVPATMPESGLLQPAPALRVPLWLPRSPL